MIAERHQSWNRQGPGARLELCQVPVQTNRTRDVRSRSAPEPRRVSPARLLRQRRPVKQRAGQPARGNSPAFRNRQRPCSTNRGTGPAITRPIASKIMNIRANRGASIHGTGSKTVGTIRLNTPKPSTQASSPTFPAPAPDQYALRPSPDAYQIGTIRHGPLQSSGAGGVPDVCAISRSECLAR